MPRHVPAIVIVISALGASVAFGQGRTVPAAPVTVQASASGGRINGIVRDEVGGLVGGVNVVAMGTSLAAVQTDGSGRFSLALPAGEYILRATLERNITLLRQSTADEQPLVLASVLPPQTRPPSSAPVAEGDHAHSDMAWRLRNLPRTVLRDDGTMPGATFERASSDFTPDRSFIAAPSHSCPSRQARASTCTRSPTRTCI